MKFTTPSALTQLAALAILLHAPSAALRGQHDAPDSRQVTVALLSEASADDTVVTLGQIAKISGGSPALRNRLAKLDVADFHSSASYCIVTSDQVRFRVLLADIDGSEFRLSGAKRTMIVESEEPVTLRKLCAAAEHAVRSRYPGSASSITITASKGNVVPLVKTARNDSVRFDGAISGPVPMRGRVRVEVSINVNGKKREVVPIALEIGQRDAGLKFARNPEQPIRPVANWTPGAPPADLVVKAHDNVKVVIALGNAAHITASGEALQDGRVGQVIRVRNIDSNRIVIGRVEASGIVTATIDSTP